MWRSKEGEAMWWFLSAAVVVIGTLALDHLGALGNRRRPLTLGRFVGAMMLMFGVALIVSR